MTTICCLIALTSLTGCDDAKPSSSAPKERVPISDAIKEKSVWIYAHGAEPSLYKDMEVDSVWDFQGDGNVIVYNTPLLTLKDLKGLSDPEIISLVKENFEEFYKISGEYNPSPQPYDVIVKTDGTGNKTDREIIESKCLETEFGDKSRSLSYKKTAVVFAAPTSQTIYDTNYYGLGWYGEVEMPNLLTGKYSKEKIGLFFFKACDPGFPGFALDTPDTKEVKVD